MKHLRILTLLCLFSMMALYGTAQNDIVRLKNGSFIRGTIIEYIVGDHVKIKTEEGKVYEFPASEVLTAGGGSASARVSTPKTIAFKNKGYFNITSLGFMFGNNGWLRINPGLYTINGYQWNEHVMTGLGVGVEYMEGAGKLPITANLQYNILKGGSTPFAEAFAGYSISGKSNNFVNWWGEDMNSRNWGGFTSGAAFGFRAFTGQNVGIIMSGGYRFQMLKSRYTEAFWNGNDVFTHEVTQNSFHNRFTIRFGLIFN